MKYFLFFYFLLGINFLKAEEWCETPRVNFTIENNVIPEKLRYDFSKNNVEIREIANGDKANGLFVSSIRYGILANPMGMNGCFSDINAILKIDFASVTIYVSKDFEGTDYHDYILWHENEHARITIENVKRYLPVIRDKVTKYMMAMKIKKAETISDFLKNRRVIAKKTQDAINSIVKELINEISKFQKDFDENETKKKKSGKGSYDFSHEQKKHNEVYEKADKYYEQMHKNK